MSIKSKLQIVPYTRYNQKCKHSLVMRQKVQVHAKTSCTITNYAGIQLPHSLTNQADLMLRFPLCGLIHVQFRIDPEIADCEMRQSISSIDEEESAFAVLVVIMHILYTLRSTHCLYFGIYTLRYILVFTP